MMATAMTRGVFRYDILCRSTGAFLFCTNRPELVTRHDVVVHDTVTGDVSYGTSVEG